jgi:hypothetical protein
MNAASYPLAVEPDLVGTYPALAKSGGGYVWDDVLESEPEPGQYRHVKEPRITEWPVAFLRRPRRTPNTIPDFLAPNAPPNRLDILRGLAAADTPQE